MDREPLITAALLTAIVASLLTLLESFGVPLTAAQQDAINQFVVVLAPLAVALIARGQVTPLSSPRDADGQPLARLDGSPAIKARGK